MGAAATVGDIQHQVKQALTDLARLAWEAVPGCDGASVSLCHNGGYSTLAATHDHVWRLDAAQYETGDGPCVTAMRDRVTVVVDDYGTHRRWPEFATCGVLVGVSSSMSLPLLHGQRSIGGLNLYGRAPAAFSSRSLGAATALARQASVMVAYLHELRAEPGGSAREREVATTLQRSLLPTLPDLPGIICSARYLVGSADTQVGGDWYDVFALPHGEIGVAIGDVMGHDVAAAAAMGQLRSVLRSYAYEGYSPSLVLDRLDRLVQGFEIAEVATAMYGRLVLKDGTGHLLFSNAGHLPPLVRYPGGEVRRLDDGASTLIGAVPPGEFQRVEAYVRLPPGSLLVLYTDGLVETRTRDIDFGISRLASALAALEAGTHPEQICDALTGVLTGSAQDDDVALLAVLIDG